MIFLFVTSNDSIRNNITRDLNIIEINKVNVSYCLLSNILDLHS